MKRGLHLFLSRFFLSGCSDYNPLDVRRACRSKAQARIFFKKNKLPYAKGLVFLSPFSAFKFAQKHGFPLVVKPNVGGFSRGAYFPIKNHWQLLRATIGVKKWWHTSIIEQYLPGKNYRVLVTKRGIMSVISRYPPFVIGDGTQSIDGLIDTENQLRKKMALEPTTKPIAKNWAIKYHLKQQKIHLLSVPNVGEKVYLHHKISLKLGASVEVIDKNKISANNQQVLQKICDFFDANILGIDVICQQGIEIDFNSQKCIFLELNSRPFLDMHNNPRYGKREDLSDFYQKLNQIQVLDNEKY